VAPNSRDLNLLNYRVWQAKMKKNYKFQLKPKMTDEFEELP